MAWALWACGPVEVSEDPGEPPADASSAGDADPAGDDDASIDSGDPDTQGDTDTPGGDAGTSGGDSDAQGGDPGDEDPEPPPHPVPTVDGLTIGVDAAFWDNMDDFLFEVVGPGELELYVTLLDANFYNQGPYRALGMEIIRRPESFFANAVIPFLQRYEGTGALWAVDCLNEPESMVSGSEGNYEDWGVSWEEMRAFLAFCADSVHQASTVPVSAGSGWHGVDPLVAGRYDGLGLDFLDYHLYADEPLIASVASLDVGLPVVIGECGQGAAARDDQLQYEAVRGCFAGAEAGGYLAALSWYYDHAGSTDAHGILNPDGSWREVAQAFTEFADSPTTRVGVNLAWLDGAYDHDFGVNPFHPEWGVGYEPALARAVVGDLLAHDVSLLRLWLWEGQEALPTHLVFEDFEAGSGGFVPARPEVTIYTSTLDATDGVASLVLHIEAGAAGWYGVTRSFSEDVRLNLEPASSIQLSAANGLGVSVGVNFAFSTGGVVYQTLPGGGQLWLAPGGAGATEAALGAAGFSGSWAKETSPGVGAARPADAAMQGVDSLRIRVYLSAGVSGDLRIDGLRVQ